MADRNLSSGKKETDPKNKAIGKRLQMLAKYKGISQEDLAGMLDISPRHMANIEAGTRGLTLENAEILADKLSESLDYIYRGKAVTENVDPFIQLIMDTLNQFRDEEHREFYMNTIINLSHLMRKV